jgi:hypothetical protein
MKKMIEKCNGALNKEENIKKNQLFGIEYQPEIYPLAVSNMLLHAGIEKTALSVCFDNNSSFSLSLSPFCAKAQLIGIIATHKPCFSKQLREY